MMNKMYDKFKEQYYKWVGFDNESRLMSNTKQSYLNAIDVMVDYHKSLVPKNPDEDLFLLVHNQVIFTHLQEQHKLIQDHE